MHLRMESENMDKEDKPLKEREQTFLNSYLQHGNGKQAALDAGYPESYAAQAAAQIKKRPHVQKALEIDKEEVASRLQINLEWSLRHLKDVADTNATKFEDKYGNRRQIDSKSVIAAVDSISKHLGYLSPEKHSHDVSYAEIDQQVLSEFEKEY